MVTSGTRNKLVFILIYLQDMIALLIFIFSLIFVPKANEHCPVGYTAFYKMAIFLQSFVLIRLFLFCVHYTDRAKPFYKWLKRQFDCLQTVECE